MNFNELLKEESGVDRNYYHNTANKKYDYVDNLDDYNDIVNEYYNKLKCGTIIVEGIIIHKDSDVNFDINNDISLKKMFKMMNDIDKK